MLQCQQKTAGNMANRFSIPAVQCLCSQEEDLVMQNLGQEQLQTFIFGIVEELVRSILL